MGRARTGGLIAAIIGTLSGFAAAPSGAAVPESGWVEVIHGHPANQDTYFYDAWTTGDEVWTVGTRRVDIPGSWEFRNWAQRCVAGVCEATYPRDFESPPYTNNALYGVSGTSNTDVWAVGYGRMSNGITAGTTHHFDGTAWTVIPNPVVSGGLYDVSATATDNAWAIGEESGAPAGVVLRWNGSSWQRVPFNVPGPCKPYGTPRDIDARGRWPVVVGECRVGSAQPEPMIAAYRDGAWKRMRATGIAPDDDLQSVAWVGKQAWAVGSTNFGGTALAVRWNKGDGWDAVSTGGAVGSLSAVAGKRTKDVWAVGYSGCCYRLALHWDGTTWAPDYAGEYGFLNGVAVSTDGTAWAVGQEQASSLIIRHDP